MANIDSSSYEDAILVVIFLCFVADCLLQATDCRHGCNSCQPHHSPPAQLIMNILPEWIIATIGGGRVSLGGGVCVEAEGITLNPKLGFRSSGNDWQARVSRL